jgi:hypothetical protein
MLLTYIGIGVSIFSMSDGGYLTIGLGVTAFIIVFNLLAFLAIPLLVWKFKKTN